MITWVKSHWKSLAIGAGVMALLLRFALKSPKFNGIALKLLGQTPPSA